jgi:hypothetical protein
MNLLVMAPEPVDADTVKSALGADDLGDAKILYVSPALNESAVAFWVSDSDEAIAEAQERAEQTEAALSEAGAQAKGVTGESEPLLALQDALATFDADRILVFVRSDEEQRYREDDIVGEAERRFSVPVTQAAL